MMPNNPIWNIGDLLITTRNSIAFRACLDKASNACILLSSAGQPVRQTELEEGTVVMALDPKPIVGAMARVRIFHDGTIWVANSNYVKRWVRD